MAGEREGGSEEWEGRAGAGDFSLLNILFWVWVWLVWYGFKRCAFGTNRALWRAKMLFLAGKCAKGPVLTEVNQIAVFLSSFNAL